MDKDYTDIAKKIVQNPNQIEEILDMLESKMELNPLIKELNYARRFPRDIFGDEIDSAKYISDISNVMDIVLSRMDKENFISRDYKGLDSTTMRKMIDLYDFDCMDLGTILAYNPEQLDKIVEADMDFMGWNALEEILRDIISEPGEYFWEENDTNALENNVRNVLPRVSELAMQKNPFIKKNKQVIENPKESISKTLENKDGHGKIRSIEIKALNTIIKYEDEYEVSLETFEVFGNNRTATEKCEDERFEQYGELTNYEAEIGSAYGSYAVATGKIKEENYSPKDFVDYTGLDVNIVKLLANAGNISGSKEADKQVYDLLQAYKRIHGNEPMQDGDQELISGILSFDLEGLDKVGVKELNKDGAKFSNEDLTEIKEEIANSALCCETSEIAQGINSDELKELVTAQEMSSIKKALATFKQYVRNIKDKIFNKNQGER